MQSCFACTSGLEGRQARHNCLCWVFAREDAHVFTLSFQLNCHRHCHSASPNAANNRLSIGMKSLVCLEDCCCMHAAIVSNLGNISHH